MWALSALAAILLAACGDESPEPGAQCTSRATLPSLERPESRVQGEVTLRDLTVVRVNQGQVGQVQVTQLSAEFKSVTSTVEVEQVMQYGVCYGLIGRPPLGESERLDAGNLHLETEGRTLVFDRDPDNFTYTLVPQSPLPPAGSQVEVVAGGSTSTTGETFPAFSSQTTALEPLVVLEPDLDEPLSLDPEALTLRWEPGDGEYVKVEIKPVRQPGDSTFGGSVECFFQDTGCAVVPSVATRVALVEPVNDFRILMTRTRAVRSNLPDGATLDLKLESRIDVAAIRGDIP